VRSSGVLHVILASASLVLAVSEPAPAPAPAAAPSAAPAAAPAGMTFVNGASVTVGEKQTQRTFTQPAFYIDGALATVADLTACAGGERPMCLPTSPEGKAIVQKAKAASAKDPKALVEMTWELADAYCAWSGKRLPTDGEWETAVDKGALKGALTGALTGAGGAREWTSTWFVAAATCKEPKQKIPDAQANNIPDGQCGTHDIYDPCDSAFFCGTLTQKVMKDVATPRARTGGGYLGPKVAHVRCASTTGVLARYPSVHIAKPYAQLDVPAAPTAAELALFNKITEDVLDTPLCEEAGRSFANCRDPRSYLKSNEPRLDVVVPYLKNLGGGYTGVASDQNYTFVAQAKSRWAWLFDYDPNVVNWHKVLRAFILKSATRAELVEWFDAKKLKEGAQVLRDAGEPKEVVTLYLSSGARMKSEYVTQSKRTYSWLGNDESYAYIRAMYQQGRMKAFKGNMLEAGAMRTIGESAKALGVPMRIYYPSNAPEFWLFTPQYRANVAGLPFDDKSIVVQTISSWKTGYDQKGYWHYNIQDGRDHHRLMALPGYQRLRQLFYHRTRTETGELTTTALPPG
jgi:hypothetical protein